METRRDTTLVSYEASSTGFHLGDKNPRGKPREKIRGSQFVKREEKNQVKVRINPFEKWKQKSTPPKKP